MTIFPQLEAYIATLDLSTIAAERKVVLQALVDFIQTKVNAKESIRLNFICTHNSRRSHLSQVWAQTLAAHAGIKDVFSYSGGTEATALFPVVAETLKQTGFEIHTLSSEKKPVYSIKFAANQHPVIGFSKTFDNPFNPTSDFAAILTCSQADADCPFIAGAEKRIALPFEDPKAFDHTPQQAEKYAERSRQIATELHYVFTQIQHEHS